MRTIDSTRTLGTIALTALASLWLLGCGGGDGSGDQGSRDRAEQTVSRQEAVTGGQQRAERQGDGGQAAGADRQGVPAWMEVSDSDQTVELDVVAARTSANSNWNFNGYANGDATITVPRGYEVTIEFSNEDPAVAHSLGIDEKPDRWSATFKDPQPVFEGAITSNPASMSRATAPGSSETITFTAERAGEYAMVCYIPGHATAGMWIWFHVSPDGSSGFTTTGS